jgi:hypothetical protein
MFGQFPFFGLQTVRGRVGWQPFCCDEVEDDFPVQLRTGETAKGMWSSPYLRLS